MANEVESKSSSTLKYSRCQCERLVEGFSFRTIPGPTLIADGRRGTSEGGSFRGSGSGSQTGASVLLALRDTGRVASRSLGHPELSYLNPRTRSGTAYIITSSWLRLYLIVQKAAHGSKTEKDLVRLCSIDAMRCDAAPYNTPHASCTSSECQNSPAGQRRGKKYTAPELTVLSMLLLKVVRGAVRAASWK